MVQNSDRKKVKEKVYDIATNIGMKLFAEYWGKASLKATDRWIEYPWVLENLPQSAWNTILDVGCAGSMFPLLLKALKYDVYGIDIQPHAMKDKFGFIQEDIIKFHHNWSFDAITAISTIEHIEDSQKAVDNIHNCLKPKGLLLMTVPYHCESRQTKFHFLHSGGSLNELLKNFNWQMDLVDSPETDSYKLALIRATK